jgi:hypothetical protein
LVVAAGTGDWPDEPPCAIETIGIRPIELGIATYHDSEPSEQSALVEVEGHTWKVQVRLDIDGRLGLLLKEDSSPLQEAWDTSAVWSTKFYWNLRKMS